MRLILLLVNAVACQFNINNLIISTPSPPRAETTDRERTETVYDENLNSYPDLITGKLSKEEEFIEKDRQKKVKKFENTSFIQAPMYTTDHEVQENDPIEQEIVDMVPRANGFFEDSGIQLAPNQAEIRPIGTDAEITMTRSTLSDITAPDIQDTSLEMRTLPPQETNEIEESASTFPPVSYRSQSYRKLALESAVDMAVIPKMHHDVQKLIKEVADLKKLVFKLLHLHEKDRMKVIKRRRNSRRVTGTSSVLPDRLTATRTDHFIHTFDDKHRKEGLADTF